MAKLQILSLKFFCFACSNLFRHSKYHLIIPPMYDTCDFAIKDNTNLHIQWLYQHSPALKKKVENLSRTKASLLSPRKHFSCLGKKKKQKLSPLQTSPYLQSSGVIQHFPTLLFFQCCSEMGVMGICGYVKSLQLLNDA